MLNKLYEEKEISIPMDLCNVNGKLNSESIGWARHPVFNCNLSARWLRKKKWNYWCITNEDCLFSVTISNLDYAGMAFVYFLDFKTHKYIEETVMTPFGKGCFMSQTVGDTVTFDHKKLSLHFIKEGPNTHITAHCSNFGGSTLSADFIVFYPEDHETLNVVIPWDEKTFQFTSKHQCLPVQGTLKVGTNSYNFNQEHTFACLDYGRGIWPYKVNWNWATASGIINGQSVGLNLGAKWTDGTGMTESGIVVNGKITKLSEDIVFEYDSKAFMKPWRIKTAVTNRVDLTFKPFYERIAKSNFAVIKSEVHQMVGHFSGEIQTDSGQRIVIENLIGCSEDHFGQW